MKSRLMLLILCLLLAAAPACAGQQEWTVLVYMVAADLETHGLATADLQEMLEASAQLNAPQVWVCTGGTAGVWQTQGIPSDECAVWQVKNGQLEYRASLGAESMGESQTLSRFIGQVPQTSRMMLVLWDHGRGPLVGFGRDDAHGGDSLTLAEIREALQDAPHFDLVAMDACLMSTMETAAALKEHADYALLSQEAEPADGYDYRFLALLVDAPNGLEAGREAARFAMDAWREPYLAWPAFEPPLSVSLLDLSRVSDVQTVLQPFLAQLMNAAELGGYPLQARIHEQTAQPGRYTMVSDYDTVDLYDLCRQYGAYFSEETQLVMAELDELVVQSFTNTEKLGGVSLYLPRSNPALYDAFESVLQTAAVCEAQVQLSHIYAERLNDTSAEYETLALPQTELNEIAFQLTAEQAEHFVAASVVLYQKMDEQTYEVMGAVRDVVPDAGNVLRYTFENRALYLQNAQGERAHIPLMDVRTSDGVTRARAYAVLVRRDAFDESGLYREDSTLNVLLDMAFSEQGEAQLIGLQTAEELSSGKNALRLQDFGEIMFSGGAYQPALDDNGQTLPFAQWRYAEDMQVAVLSVDDGMTLQLAPYPEGDELYAQFQLKDVYGELYASELIKVK